MQGAFNIKRYLPRSEKYWIKVQDHFFADNLYENHENFVDTAIYTTSNNDKLLSLMAGSVIKHFRIWTSINFIGSVEARELASKKRNKGFFSFTTLNRDGNLVNGEAKLEGKNICWKDTPVLVNADDSIINTVPGSDKMTTGAHSDIYNPRIGRFLWNVINECTILNQAPETN